MKIQLIHPPVYVNPSALTALRPAPPLGLAYVAAALRQAGQEGSALDAVAAAPTQTARDGRVLRLGLTDDEIAERVDQQAQAVGITNMWSFAWPATRSMICAIRKRFPDKIIVCGGEHFTALPELSMRQAPIDYIVLGEGEEITVELNRAGFDGAINIEWEDNDVDKFDGARIALANVHAGDAAPSFQRHDESLQA